MQSESHFFWLLHLIFFHFQFYRHTAFIFMCLEFNFFRQCLIEKVFLGWPPLSLETKNTRAQNIEILNEIAGVLVECWMLKIKDWKSWIQGTWKWMQCDYRIENGKISNVGTKKMTFWLQQFKNPKYEKWKPENLDLWKREFGKQKFWLQSLTTKMLNDNWKCWMKQFDNF